MEEKMITIPVEEYKRLLEERIRIGIFSDFVKSAKYSIEKEDCRRFFRFNVEDKED